MATVVVVVIGYLLSSPPGSRNPASDEGSGTVIVVWFFAGYVAAPVAYLTVAAITIKRLFPTGQHRYGWISVLLPIVLLIGLLARFG